MTRTPARTLGRMVAAKGPHAAMYPDGVTQRSASVLEGLREEAPMSIPAGVAVYCPICETKATELVGYVDDSRGFPPDQPDRREAIRLQPCGHAVNGIAFGVG